jgi:glycosyltransferase involved in cell wall biosynthesis
MISANQMTTPLHVGFVMEQALGHITHTKNLQMNVPQDSRLIPHWALIPMETHGLAAKIPIYKSNWTVRAGLRARREIERIWRAHDLDVLFFHTQVPAVLATNWAKRIPSIVSLDATPLQYDELGEFYQHQKGAPWLEHWKWQMNRDCFKAARHIVAWTEWTRFGLLSEYQVREDKVTVIPPGVNVGEWKRPTPRTRNEGVIKILFVGGDLRRKGGLDLLNAFRALRGTHAIELHLATRDSLPSEPGIFVYNNMQPNSAALKQLYYDADIFCLPTFGDCLPMVLSEAGAAGLPSISTTVAGIPEIIANGETGLLVPRGNVRELTRALEQLVENPDLRLAMGMRAIERISAKFDAQKNTTRLIDLIESVGVKR